MNDSKNILITGGRAPVALELARLFRAQNNVVFVAESVPRPLSGFSKSVSGVFKVEKPARNFKMFLRGLIDIIRKKSVDIVIPTCEETLYVSEGKPEIERKTSALVFADNIERLAELHNKYRFIKLAEKIGLAVPETFYLDSRDKLKEKSPDLARMILKPVYSRFGLNIYKRPDYKSLSKIDISPSFPWVAQRLVKGDTVCSYGAAWRGKLRAYSAYKAEHKAGEAAVAFSYYKSGTLLSHVKRIVERLGFTGQISLDWILDESGVFYPVECNPRATSGVHILRRAPGFSEAFLNPERENTVYPPPDSDSMLALAMISHALPSIRSFKSLKRWLKTFKSSRDVIFEKKDKGPFWGQFRGYAYFAREALKNRISPLEACALDIEWNGKTEA